MPSSFTNRFRPFVWCTIVLFTLSSIPHIDIALRSAAVFLPSTAHAEEIEARGSKPQTSDSPYSAAVRTGESHDTPGNSEILENESDEGAQDTADRSVSTNSVTTAAGGADKPMGESLPAVDSMIFTGAATARIPIEVSPGRLGIAPNIAFVYNSYRGNGPLGVGWDIDLGAVQRATKKGVSYSNNDYVAMINGSTSDLVPRSDWGANYYGAKIEGALSKFFYNGSTGGWEVTTKEGTRYYYGSASASRQDFSGGYVFKWCLDKVQDTNGNSMTVTYMKNQGQIYPSTITYAANAGVAAAHSVQFNWVTGRSDVLPMVTTNFPVKTAYRLSSVDNQWSATLQRKYVTQYTTSTTSKRLLLTSVTEYGKNGGALPPTSITWQQGTNDWGAFSGIQDDLCPNEGYSDAHTYPMVIGDFNGDGRTEVGRVAAPGVSFYQPTDSGWQVMPFLSDYGTNQGYSDANTYPLLIGDFNGDGKTEVGRTGMSGTNFYQLTGSGWQMSSSFGDFGQNQGYDSANTHPVIVGDFDGDGRTDVGRVASTGVTFYRLTDSGWQMMSCLNDFGQNQGYAGDNPLLIGDFNGDGRTDVGRVHENGTKFYQQTQSGWQFMGSISDFGEREECPVPNPAYAVFINENRLPFFSATSTETAGPMWEESTRTAPISINSQAPAGN